MWDAKMMWNSFHYFEASLPFVSKPETVPEPLNLRSSEVSTESFRVTWEHSAQDVVLYRLTWTPIRGGDTKEVCVWLSYPAD
jgi:hypothetical protein